jgi:hypothetical protein
MPQPAKINITTKNNRHGKQWTVNECLQLHREFELLELTVNEMAIKHNRTSNAIIYKLHQEGLAVKQN